MGLSIHLLPQRSHLKAPVVWQTDASGIPPPLKTNVQTLLFAIKILSILILPSKIHNIFSLFSDIFSSESAS